MTAARPAGVSGDVLALGLATAVVLAGMGLQASEGHVHAGGRGLPRTCILHHAGLGNCPGCGLTRSVVACCHLRWRDSLRFHPAGVLVVLLALAQIPFRLRRICARDGAAMCRWLSPLTRGTMVLVLAIGLGRWMAEWTVRFLWS
jgi:hypothetical protein